MSTQGPRKIVIIGGGFAGAYCAKTLMKKLRPGEAHVSLINTTNFFAFTPLLVEAGTGALEPRHAVVPLRRFTRGADLCMGEVIDIDFDRKQVTYENAMRQRRHVQYDHLVIAPGSVTNLPDVPGLREYAFTLKSLGDAIALRDRAVGMLELAEDCDDPVLRRELLTFVVVGGSYTGVEVAGEFNDFLRSATRYYKNIEPNDIRIVLVEMQKHILGMLDPDLADYALQRLRYRGVEVHLEETASEIAPNHVNLKSHGRIDTQNVIWTAGIAPSPLLEKLDLPTDQRGYVLCDADLRVQRRQNLWAIGDCAVNIDPNGDPYPATAQHAVREGHQCAENIIHLLRGEDTQPLVYRSQGMLAPLGYHEGVARVFGFKIAGLAAWFLWRTIYLIKMPGPGRGLRVMLDWTLDWFFRRDYIQLGIHGVKKPRPRAPKPSTEASKDHENSSAA